jgi:S-DNA-T family DNA segregation ATPase FtsK/SpoIIIE
LARALVAELATFHAPDDLLIAVCVSDTRRQEWEWAKWLPHALHPVKVDAVGPVRLFAPSVAALEAMLDDVLASRLRFAGAGQRQATLPHIVVLIDGGTTTASDHLMTEAGLDGVTLLDLSGQPPRLLDETVAVLEVGDDGSISGITMDGPIPLGRSDSLENSVAEVLARELAPLRLSAAAYVDHRRSVDLGLRTYRAWRPVRVRSPSDLATKPARPAEVPIGMGMDGRAIELTSRSPPKMAGPRSARGYDRFPEERAIAHIAGARRDWLRILNFSSWIQGRGHVHRSRSSPHTSAVITNLAEELSLVDRMLGAIQGELMRRQNSGEPGTTPRRDYSRLGRPVCPC